MSLINIESRKPVNHEPKAITSDWLKPPEEEASLARYIETVRERLWLIIAIVLVTIGVAVLYVATAEKTYEAEADLIITPVDSNNSVLASLGLIQASADPNRDVETASRLVTNIAVAERAAEELGSSKSPEQLLKKVTAQPVAQSSIVAITAEASTAEGAKELADTFAEQTIAYRTSLMRSRIDEILPRLETEAARVTSDSVASAQLQSQIGELLVLRTGNDPTMRIETLATMPTAPASPRPVMSLAAAIFAGLVLGIGAAFLSQILDPKLRRESQLRHLYSLPILGRIPREARSLAGTNPLDPRAMTPAIAESYRTLRTTLIGPRPRTDRGGKVIFVTGSAPAEGKTTTAVSLATSLAVSGRRVVLIESDLRRPVIGPAFDIKPKNGGVVSVLLENSEFRDSLVQIDSYGPNLNLLLADYEGGWITELFSIPAAEEMLRQARQMADVVIIDSPPLNEVVDALPLAQMSDDVLLVVRLGVTRLDRLSQLGELLAENSIVPAGFAVIGTPRPKRSESHYYVGNEGKSPGNRRFNLGRSDKGSTTRKRTPRKPRQETRPEPAKTSEVRSDGGSLPPPSSR